MFTISLTIEQTSRHLHITPIRERYKQCRPSGRLSKLHGHARISGVGGRGRAIAPPKMPQNVRCESTSNWRVLSSRHCLARHLRTWLTTYIWSWKGLDAGSARLPTDRVLSHAHNTFGDRSFAVAGPRVWNSLPANLRDEDITYTSFRRELKTYWFSCGRGAIHCC